MSHVLKAYPFITAADGSLATINGVATTKIPARGLLHTVAVLNNGTLTGGGTLTLTDDNTGLILVNAVTFTAFTAAKQKAIRPVAITDAAGTAIADAVTAGLATGTLTLAISGGGNAKSGVLWLAWEI